MMTTTSRPGSDAANARSHLAPAGEGAARRVAALDRHVVGGGQVAQREDQRRHQAGQDQAQHADRGDARGRQREDDQVVRGRHQRADQRRVRRHVDRVVGVVALLLHQRDHHRAHRRHVGQRRAGDAAEQRAAEHVAHAQAAAHVADQAVGEAHDAVGDAAVEHQLAGEHEERDRQEARTPACRRPSSGTPRPSAGRRRGWWRPTTARSRTRPARRAAAAAVKLSAQDGQFHAGSTSSPRSSAMMCSIENSTISAPAITSGR